MVIFGRLGKEGSDLINQAATSIVGGTGGSSLKRKGVCKKRVSEVITVTTQVSVTTQITILRRVQRYKPTLRVHENMWGRDLGKWLAKSRRRDTSALPKGIRFLSERHLPYNDGGGKKSNSNKSSSRKVHFTSARPGPSQRRH